VLATKFFPWFESILESRCTKLATDTKCIEVLRVQSTQWIHDAYSPCFIVLIIWIYSPEMDSQKQFNGTCDQVKCLWQLNLQNEEVKAFEWCEIYLAL